MHSVTHRGFGNMLGWLGDQAEKLPLVLRHDQHTQRCESGNHRASKTGGVKIGGKFVCEKCKGKFL